MFFSLIEFLFQSGWCFELLFKRLVSRETRSMWDRETLTDKLKCGCSQKKQLCKKWHCGLTYFSFSGTSRSNWLSWKVNQWFSNCQCFSSVWELKIKLRYFFLLLHCQWCWASNLRWCYYLWCTRQNQAQFPYFLNR